MFLTVLNITFILVSALWKNMFSMWRRLLFSLLPKLTFATSCCSLHQFFLPPSSSSLKYFGLLSSEEVVFREVLGLGCVPASVRASLCPWIYKHVPSISSFHRQGLSLCASLNCRLVFPIFLPKGQQEHISHICGRPSLHHFSLAVIYSSFNISFFICLPIKNRITPQHMYATFHATF